MCSNRRRSVISTVLAVAFFGASVPRSSLGADPTAADKSAAQEMFAAGMELRENGDHKAALPKFRAAYDRVPSPITALELGRAWMLIGKLVEAQERFIDASKMPSKSSESPAAKTARAEADRLGKELLPRIPTIVVIVHGASPTTMSIDDEDLPLHVLGSPHRVNPGTHRIVAKASGASDQEVSFSLKDGEKKEVEISFPSKVDGSTPAGSSPKTSTLAYVGFGGAGVGVVAGVIALLVRSAKANCQEPCAQGTNSDIKLATGMAFGSFAFAAAGAGLGLYGLTLSSDGGKRTATMQPWVGWKSAGIQGRF